MRTIILGATLAATAILPLAGASAQNWRHHDRGVRAEQRECARELRRADSRWEYRRELAECRREIRQEARESRWDRRRDRWEDRHWRDRYDDYGRRYR